jgi:hypothetical protein
MAHTFSHKDPIEILFMIPHMNFHLRGYYRHITKLYSELLQNLNFVSSGHLKDH